MDNIGICLLFVLASTILFGHELMMISAEVQELPVTVRRVNVQREREKNNLNLNMSDFIEFVPLETRKFFDELTEHDKAVLKNVLSNSASYSNVSQLLQYLRNESSTLYNKAVESVTGIRKTIAGLSPSARSFVDETAVQAQNCLKEEISLSKLKSEVKIAVDRYQSLDENTKAELKAAFPTVNLIISNPTFQLLSSALFGLGA